MEGPVSTGPTPSSLINIMPTSKMVILNSYYSNVWVSVLKWYFWYGLGSHHALLVLKGGKGHLVSGSMYAKGIYRSKVILAERAEFRRTTPMFFLAHHHHHQPPHPALCQVKSALSASLSKVCKG